MSCGDRSFHAPIVLKALPERLAAGLLCCGFFGLVLLLLGVVGRWIVMGAAGAALILAGVLWTLYRRREEIIFETDRVVVKTPFSRKMYPYEGMSFLLRHSWTMTFRRGLVAGSGLAGVAIQLRRGQRVEVTVPTDRFGGKSVREAIDFLSRLPNQKRYL